MYIIVEIFEFIDCILNNIHSCKEKALFKFLEYLVYKKHTNIGIPTFVLFENVSDKSTKDFIDCIRYDTIKYNPVYDELNDIFVFGNVNDLFFGLREIYKKLHLIYPENIFIKERYQCTRDCLDTIKHNVYLDELCDAFSFM